MLKIAILVSVGFYRAYKLQLKPLEAKAKAANEQYVQTPYVALDTPGKATVCVVILRDPVRFCMLVLTKHGYV